MLLLLLAIQFLDEHTAVQSDDQHFLALVMIRNQSPVGPCAIFAVRREAVAFAT
jgi:hypothetical protein